MNVAFRTDASLQIGTGHVMRCLTLADALQVAGAHCYFICRKHPGNLIAQIRQRGFMVRELPADIEVLVTDELATEAQSIYAAWLGANWATDAAQTKVGVGAAAVDWLIVDHYAIDARWEQALRPSCRKLMVIDDLANRPHHCDILLDQNYGSMQEQYLKLVPDYCKMLVGSNYALLRPEFSKWREFSLKRRKSPEFKKLLITLGGVDPDNITGEILNQLKQSNLPKDIEITVILGANAPHLTNVQTLAQTMGYKTIVKANVSNMAEIIANADLAIGAAGTTTWERCSLGLPTLLLGISQNQVQAKKTFRSLGFTFIDLYSDDPNKGVEIFAEINYLDLINQKVNITIDGKGASRVVEHIFFQLEINCNKSQIGLRNVLLQPLKKDDIEIVRIWRNTDRILRSTISKKKISESEQIKWFESLTDKDKYFKIIYKGSFVGVASLSWNELTQNFDPGVFIGDETYASTGIGVISAFLLTKYAFSCLGLNELTAKILGENKAAIRMNKMLGYEFHSSDGNLVIYILSSTKFEQQNYKLIELILKFF